MSGLHAHDRFYLRTVILLRGNEPSIRVDERPAVVVGIERIDVTPLLQLFILSVLHAFDCTFIIDSRGVALSTDNRLVDDGVRSIPADDAQLDARLGIAGYRRTVVPIVQVHTNLARFGRIVAPLKPWRA